MNMNLSWLLRLLPFIGGYKQKQAAREKRDTGIDSEQDAFFSGLENAFNAAEAKYLGTALTGAEREANAFTAEQSQLAWERSQKSADIAWQREYEASNTQYQRKVADLQAAGLNPMLAVATGGSAIPSASVASASPGSSVSPGSGNLSELLNFFSRLPLLKAQVENVNADTANKEADTAGKLENTRGSKLANDFFADTQNIRSVLLSDQHERNSWERDVAKQNADTSAGMLAVEKEKSSHYNKYIDIQADLIDEQIKNQPLQRALLRANAREANASASYKAAMQSVDVKLAEASEEKTREELNLLKIESRLKQGIYTEQTIEAIAKAARAEASLKIVMEAYHRGDYRYASLELQKMFHTLEKNGELPVESWTIGTASHSTNGAASAAALPY